MICPSAILFAIRLVFVSYPFAIRLLSLCDPILLPSFLVFHFWVSPQKR